MMKLFGLGLLLAMGILFSASASAAEEIRIKVNDRTVVTDSAPYISGGYTLVPVRFVAEAFGCGNIEWDDASRCVTIDDGKNEISLKIGSRTAYVNGQEKVLDQTAQIKNNRTYIPIRFVSENMGAVVSWDEYERVVNIYRDGAADIPYSEDELFWLARIIHAEAQGEPFDGKVAVGNVVLNRVSSKDFPNTIYSVIFDTENGVQFTPVANGTIYNEPSNECYYAADRALRENNAAGESLYFCNPEISTNTWIINNRKFYLCIGKHYFYL